MTPVQLKVCEMCGALFTKKLTSESAYCGPCSRRFGITTPHRARRRRPGSQSGGRRGRGTLPTIEARASDGLWEYRGYTSAIVQRFFYLHIQLGRLGSSRLQPVGRGRVSGGGIRRFEDAVAFCVDIDRCISALELSDQNILYYTFIEERSHSDIAPLIGASVRSVGYYLGRALDCLTARFIDADILHVSAEAA